MRVDPKLQFHFVDNMIYLLPSWQSVYQTLLMWEEIVRGVNFG